MKFRVELPDGPARGYRLRELRRRLHAAGARARSAPTAWPTRATSSRPSPPTRTATRRRKLFVKWGGALWAADIDHSPLDVVAWHGNYAPYKYDLRRFSPVGPVLFDHADPSIFTVLTSPSRDARHRQHRLRDLPDRWLVAENTFRPPWYHMNVMSEFMGLIYGVYDAKTGSGFVPGGVIAAQPHAAARPGRRRVRAGAATPNSKPHKLDRHAGLHVRDALSAARHASSPPRRPPLQATTATTAGR